MGNIVDYVRKYGEHDFGELPFSEVDSLVLSQFAYLKFDNMVSGIEGEAEPVSMKELSKSPSYEKLFADERYRKDNSALFEAMLGSVRFGELTVSSYVNRVEYDRETQFAAMIFCLPSDICYVAFRGTDENIVGWKEDLNLAFSEPVPGQLMSVDYLECAAKKIDGDFYVGGHSKGGNLAVYSTMNCKKEVRDRVSLIFNHDGPGFRPEVKEKGNFKEIADRICKTVPHSSLVGMILYSQEAYRVVESKTVGLAQHNPYTWLIEGSKFQMADKVYAGRLLMDETLNQWILSLSQEQMHAFADTLYRALLASETDNLIDFSANWFQSMQKVQAALKDVDEETVQIIAQIIRKLFEMLSNNAKEMFRSKTVLEKEKFEEGISQIEQLFKK